MGTPELKEKAGNLLEEMKNDLAACQLTTVPWPDLTTCADAPFLGKRLNCGRGQVVLVRVRLCPTQQTTING